MEYNQCVDAIYLDEKVRLTICLGLSFPGSVHCAKSILPLYANPSVVYKISVLVLLSTQFCPPKPGS